jgi:type III secretion protein S
VTAALLDLLGQALWLALALALPLLAAALIAGAVSGVVGAVTQVQDSAVGFALRLAAVAVTLLALAPAMASRLAAFTSAALALIDRAASGG